MLNTSIESQYGGEKPNKLSRSVGVLSDMANHKSAKKRIRSDEKKHSRNSAYISGVRTAVKKFKQAAQTTETSKEDIDKLFKGAQAMLSKASTKGMMHKNTVSRKTSRLSSLLSKFLQGNVAVDKKPKKKKKAAASSKKKKKS